MEGRNFYLNECYDPNIVFEYTGQKPELDELVVGVDFGSQTVDLIVKQLNLEKIGSFYCCFAQPYGVSAPLKKQVFVYLSGKRAYCAIPFIPEELASSMAQSLNQLKPTHLICLCESNQGFCHLSSKKLEIPRMQPPNMVSGVSAACCIMQLKSNKPFTLLAVKPEMELGSKMLNEETFNLWMEQIQVHVHQIQRSKAMFI